MFWSSGITIPSIRASKGDATFANTASRGRGSISHSVRGRIVCGTTCGGWARSGLPNCSPRQRGGHGGASFKTVVTTDPHSYNTIRNEYPDSAAMYQIQHYTSFVKHLFDDGKCASRSGLTYRTTFTTRAISAGSNKGYEAPRDVLKLLGCELRGNGRKPCEFILLRRRRRRIWIPIRWVPEKPAQNRIKGRRDSRS